MLKQGLLILSIPFMLNGCGGDDVNATGRVAATGEANAVVGLASLSGTSSVSSALKQAVQSVQTKANEILSEQRMNLLLSPNKAVNCSGGTGGSACSFECSETSGRQVEISGSCDVAASSFTCGSRSYNYRDVYTQFHLIFSRVTDTEFNFYLKAKYTGRVSATDNSIAGAIDCNFEQSYNSADIASGNYGIDEDNISCTVGGEEVTGAQISAAIANGC